ncbi:MAG: sigma-54-dependent Fis family transcriptional regulator [Candidatus Hydrogenedentes bacterium]|nr:sigma-54-dependent Fis family transcriptional regulator [Candidatus Hydrogenedentota bacterium]
MPRILIVEDEENMRRILAVLLKGDGHEVDEAGSYASAIRASGQRQYDLALVDQKLPDGSGLDFLSACRESDLTLPVIMLTAFATVDLAVESMRQGAFDFLTKPFQPDAVLAAVRRGCEHSALLRENQRLREQVGRLEFGRTDLLGSSSVMQEVRELIARVAAADATVLIMGETGTGKELVARAIHRNSARADKPFIAVNCAAMPEPLLESQLFGHEKGAFTGAEKARQGLFEAAHGGTLFLDEAGEMSLPLQAKFLRVLMDGEVLRIGATAPRKVDVRVLAATHRDLKQRVQQGAFREDLYYRIAVVPITIPPLRQRREDLPELVEYFLDLVASDLKVNKRRICQSAMDRLGCYAFPGNVRELRNLIERAYILGRGPEITAADIPVEGPLGAPQVDGGATTYCWLQRLPESFDLRGTLERVEAMLLLRALQQSDNNQAEAARRLGISRSDMTYKIRRLSVREMAPEDAGDCSKL